MSSIRLRTSDTEDPWGTSVAGTRSLPPEALHEVDVAIVCEATYPFVTGGLSAVVHQFCTGMTGLSLGIIYIAWDSSEELIPVYDLPNNVAWVHVVYTSMAEYPEFAKQVPRNIGLPRSRRKQLVGRVFDAIEAHRAGDDSLLWALYDDGINPLTRSFTLWPALGTKEFMDAAVNAFGDTLPLSALFWTLRNFSSGAAALTSRLFPKAKVYHTHTTGGAALLAAAAARQHGSRMLLTEHNLYTRDAINLMLERSCNTIVTRDTWHELETYLGGDSINPSTREVTPDQRSWMAWITALGEIGYRAADRITYLYPEAVAEATALGSRPEVSEIIPNGIDTAPYVEGRVANAERHELIADPVHTWRLAFAARVVVIKGLLNLIEAIALLERRGVTNFTLDVMGPLQEEPLYVEACMNRIAQHGLQGRIRFIGIVHIPSTLPAYDLLVLPSLNEGAPIIILEALAMGVPVLATRVGGVEAIVAHPEPDPDEPGRIIGSAGMVVAPGDIAELADALAAAMADPERHLLHSRNAIERAEQLFHIDLTLKRYARTLDALGAPQRKALPGRRVLAPEEADPAAESPRATQPRRAAR